MEETNKVKSKGHTYRQWAVTILANMTLLSYALQTGWVSPMTKILQSDDSPVGRPLTNQELSWIGSLPSLVGMIGAPMAAFIVDKYGRRVAVMIIAFMQMLGWILKLIPSSFETLIMARIFCGLAGGSAFNVVPIYVKEICQSEIRGVAGLLLMMSQNVGILVMYTIGAYLDYYIVICITLVVPVINIILLFMAPESPVFLLKIGKSKEAATTIANLRGLDLLDTVVQNEVEIIRKEDEAFKLIPNVSFVSILKQPAWRRGILLMVVIIFAHASNGAFTIVTFASKILEQSGVTMSPELQSLSIPVFMIIGSIVSMTFVEKLGRKPIFATSFILSAITMSGLGTILVLQKNNIVVSGWIPIAAIIVCVCCYAAGVSPLPFVIISEMFNFQVRTKVMCCLVIQAWMISFVQLFSYSSVSDAFGAHVSFFMFAVTNVLGAFSILVFLPETKGKTVEEIEKDLMRKKLC